jgi:hypothetical protein
LPLHISWKASTTTITLVATVTTTSFVRKLAFLEGRKRERRTRPFLEEELTETTPTTAGRR